MSPSTVTPFVREVPDLFPPDAFEPPPVTRPPPDPPADWISFPPKDGPSHFDDFRRSPLFERTRAQILDRVGECEAFARAHSSQREAEQILDGFDTFRRNLLQGDGEAFFTQGLPTLYGYGKRHFDGFCLRLAQDDLNLEQRKTALRELAQQLHLCGSTGPAFLTAYLMLDRAQGGLRSEFHDALLMRMEALLIDFVNQDPPGSDPSPEAVLKRQHWRRQMEVHMVNRLKLELGLPGGNPADSFSFGSNIYAPEQLPRCKAFLKQHLRPTVLARDLAERYVARLQDALPEPLRDPQADLSEATPLIGPAHTQLNASFGSIGLHHLLSEDDATGQVRWNSDVTLVALDVLHELETLGLVVRTEPMALMHSVATTWEWELLHVDWKLFFVNERWPPATEVAPVPVQLRHLRSMVETSPPGSSTVNTLVDAVLQSEPPDRLMDILPEWLGTEGQMRAQLQTLGGRRSMEWLARHTPDGVPEPVLQRLLPALTELGMSEVLGKVMTPSHRFTPRDWMAVAGGMDMLHRSIREGDATCQSLWCTVLYAARHELSGADLQEAFLVPGQPSLLTLALLRNSDVLLSPLLGLLLKVRRAGKIDNATLIRLMEVPIQHAMAEGVLTSLIAFGTALQDMARFGWLRSGDLRRLLEGPVAGAGCSSAMVAGQADVVQWLHRCVVQLYGARLLNQGDARALVAAEGAPGEESAVMKAVRAHRPQALEAHLKALLNEVRAGLLPAAWLPRLLGCMTGDGRPAVALMLAAQGKHPCLGPWRQAVAQASHDLLISRSTLCELLAAPDDSGTPFLRDLVRRGGCFDHAVEWLETVKCFQQLNRITEAEVLQLLEARGPGRLGQQESVLHAAMTTWNLVPAVSFFFSLFGRAARLQMISSRALAHLLKAGRANEPETSALRAAIEQQQTGRLKEYLTELLWLFQCGTVEAPMRWRLLDGRTDGGHSALAAAVDEDQPQAVVALLAASQQAAQQQLITGEDWCRTLLATQPDGRRPTPQAGAAGPDLGPGLGAAAGMLPGEGPGALDHLRHRLGRRAPNPEIVQAFDHALTVASAHGLLAGPRGTEVLHRWISLRAPTEPLETIDSIVIDAVDPDSDDENGPPLTSPHRPTQA